MKTTWNVIKYVFLIIFLLLIITLFPLRQLIFSGIPFQKNLILLVNDSETRPCGGFITAYGVWDLKTKKIPLENIYNLDNFEFGNSKAPLTQIASIQKFWDLGTDPNMYACAENFLAKFKTIKPEEQVDNIILVNISAVEEILTLFKTIEINNTPIKTNEIFQKLSQSAADIDRHNIESLNSRKKIAMNFKKPLLKAALKKPYLWPIINYKINNQIKNRNIYIPQLSKNINPSEKDFWIEEWNLGGGKSSRFLNKKISINAKELSPENWEIVTTFSAEHFGGTNEPISQDWKGNLILHFPKFLAQESISNNLKIPPYKKWKKSFTHNFNGNLLFQNFSTFKHNGQQNLDIDINISVFPQKTIISNYLITNNNWGHLTKTQTKTREFFNWDEATDSTAPFITFHEPLSLNIFPKELQKKLKAKKLFFIELHFNENILITDNFKVTLVDKNIANKESNILILKYKELLKDQHSMILGFSQSSSFQQDEQYELNISGIEDLFKNKIIPNRPRTIITKINSEIIETALSKEDE